MRLLFLLLLTGCEYSVVSTGPMAQASAVEALAKCRTVCPSGTTAQALSSYDGTAFTTHWTCGCMDPVRCQTERAP